MQLIEMELNFSVINNSHQDSKIHLDISSFKIQLRLNII